MSNLSIHELLQTPEVIEEGSKNCRKAEEMFPRKKIKQISAEYIITKIL